MLSFSKYLMENVELTKTHLGTLHTGYRHTTKEGGHAITTMFHRAKGLTRHTWTINFFHHPNGDPDDENAFDKSSWEGTAKSNKVPPRTASKLMFGAHKATKKFFEQEKPHEQPASIKLERDPEDPTKDEMVPHYRSLAQRIQRRYGGRVEITRHGAKVHFNEN
jgi:hypothetical protein